MPLKATESPNPNDRVCRTVWNAEAITSANKPQDTKYPLRIELNLCLFHFTRSLLMD